MKGLFLGILTILMVQTQARETLIQGQIKGFDQKEIRLQLVEDYITATKLTATKAIIKEGRFSLKLDLEQTTQVFLKIEDKESSFFAEAGEVYNLMLSYDPEKNEKSAFIKLLDLKMAFPKANELNQLIKKFNQEYQAFFAANYQKFVIKAAGEEIEKFIEEQQAKEKYQQPPFMANYAKYALANLEDINRAPKQKLYERYLKDEPILHHHKEYMNFFTQYYKADFGQYCITKKGVQFLKAVMIEKDLEKSIEILMKDKSIEQEALAELYLIHGLYEVYHKKTIEQASVLFMLKELESKAILEENRETAGFVRSKLMQFGKDLKAPAFKLLNSNGKEVSLESLKGKPVYLGFWASWSIPSIRQLSIIKKLHADYGDKINFVSINLDEDTKSMIQTKNDRELDWHFLHYGKDYDLREKYDVRTIPSYYLIDSQGKMMQTYAPAPADVDRMLFELSK